jgi:threonine dehydrogenase-like Zn-dependent dehydrogenase
MKALVVNGEWRPKKGYDLSAHEGALKRALSGSACWRDTTFEIKEAPVPRIEDDQVLIRVRSCGICGSDVHLFEKDKDGYILFSGLTSLPRIIGHEFSGTVEKTGKGVRGFKKGDMVACESIMWCGECEECRSGHPNQCNKIELLGLSADGALAEFVAVNQRYCWDIGGLKSRYPEKEAFEIGSLIEPVGCAYNGIFVAGKGFPPGATVAVHGLGPIGLGAVGLSRLSGAGLIIAFDENPERAGVAKEMGADLAFDPRGLRGRSSSQVVMEVTAGCGADIQVEAAGAAERTIPQMVKSLAPQGKIIYLGRSAIEAPVNVDSLVSGANALIGARGHAGYGIFPNIIRLIAGGRLDLKPMISKRYEFRDAIKAVRESAKRRGGKVIVNI